MAKLRLPMVRKSDMRKYMNEKRAISQLLGHVPIATIHNIDMSCFEIVYKLT